MTANVPPLELANYQRAVRVLLANHMITRTFPDRVALALVRRWVTELRDDMAELFGYRLEVTETTARLFPVIDELDATRPARTTSDREFDRRRYAFLALTLAVLGRAGDQLTLSELADQVAAEAARVPGLELATDRAADRDAFVDAVGWLTVRGALVLADGDAGSWAADPAQGEALYDIDRQVVIALFRPPRAIQQIPSVRALLADGDLPMPDDGEDLRSGADLAKRVRRALVQLPVVYTDQLTPAEAGLLTNDRLIAEVELCTGLSAERRAEGVCLIDTSGRLSDIRFPSAGTVAQVALLLAGEIADRVLDLDTPVPVQPAISLNDYVQQLDSSMPASPVAPPPAATAGPSAAIDGPAYPFIERSWVQDTVAALAKRYGKTFAAQWQADPRGLAGRAVALLEQLRLIQQTAGGLLALPALARYRGAVVTVRQRRTEPDLFAGEGNL